jgi:hypothetical protein
VLATDVGAIAANISLSDIKPSGLSSSSSLSGGAGGVKERRGNGRVSLVIAGADVGEGVCMPAEGGVGAAGRGFSAAPDTGIAVGTDTGKADFIGEGTLDAAGEETAGAEEAAEEDEWAAADAFPACPCEKFFEGPL